MGGYENVTGNGTAVTLPTVTLNLGGYENLAIMLVMQANPTVTLLGGYGEPDRQASTEAAELAARIVSATRASIAAGKQYIAADLLREHGVTTASLTFSE